MAFDFFFGTQKLPESSRAFLAARALAFAITVIPEAACEAPADTVLEPEVVFLTPGRMTDVEPDLVALTGFRGAIVDCIVNGW